MSINKEWVHLQPEEHLFDQTNGIVNLDTEGEHLDGMSDEEHMARAAVMSSFATSSFGSH